MLVIYIHYTFFFLLCNALLIKETLSTRVRAPWILGPLCLMASRDLITSSPDLTVVFQVVCSMTRNTHSSLCHGARSVLFFKKHSKVRTKGELKGCPLSTIQGKLDIVTHTCKPNT